MHQEHDNPSIWPTRPSIPNRYSEIKFNGVTFKKDDCFVTAKAWRERLLKDFNRCSGFKNVQTTFLMRVAGFEAKRTGGQHGYPVHSFNTQPEHCRVSSGD